MRRKQKNHVLPPSQIVNAVWLLSHMKAVATNDTRHGYSRETILLELANSNKAPLVQEELRDIFTKITIIESILFGVEP